MEIQIPTGKERNAPDRNPGNANHKEIAYDHRGIDPIIRFLGAHGRQSA
jgi:hypothetical protein